MPYTIPIYDAIADDRHRAVFVAMGAQMSKTELCLNVLGHRLSDGPYVPCMYAMPTQDMARSMSEDRFSKMIRSVPVLYERLEKGQRDRKTEKFFAGIRLGFAWMGSASQLSSHPVGFAVADEIDRADRDVGNEGDPVELIEARLSNFANSKLLVVSTPTLEGDSPIWARYEDGSMGKWTWICPHCADPFIPSMELLMYPEGASPRRAAAEAFIACPHCGAEIRDQHKHALNAGGFYTFHQLDENGHHIPLEGDPGGEIASFWVSGLCSPWRSFGQAAARLAGARKDGSYGRLKAVTNTIFGEVFRLKGDAPDWSVVMEKAGDYPPATAPHGVQLITAGVDVQKTGLFYVVRGFGHAGESWLLEHGFLAGETRFDDVWLRLTRQLQREYSGKRIQSCFVDSGYNPRKGGLSAYEAPETYHADHQVYAYCRKSGGLAQPTKGHDKLDGRTLRAAKIDVTMGGKVIRGGVTLWHLSTDTLKTNLYQRLDWPAGEPGDIHFHRDVDEDYARQLTAEEVVTEPKRGRVWIRRQRDNHYLDAEINAWAAAEVLQVHTLRPIEEVEAAQREREKTDSKQSEPNQRFIKRPEGSFFRR